jgi:cytochrome b
VCPCGIVLFARFTGRWPPASWLGYACLSLVAARLVWGFVGSSYARFSQFLPRPALLFSYIGLLLRGKEPRYLGHNPAGAVMIVLLLIGVTASGITGWLLTTDRFWGDDFMEGLHEIIAYGTL